MNILFLTILRINEVSDRGIYPDLMRKFSNEGHNVFIITPVERRYRQKTILERENNVSILRIRSLNFQKTNALEKWLATLIINVQFLMGLKKYFADVTFDLVIYSTPPITFTNIVEYVKQKDGAFSYLLLKDIFPQNAVDLVLIRKGGLLHKYFLNKEKELYRISDFIGCMSSANVDYLRKNNPEIKPEKIEVNPNSHELFEEPITAEMKEQTRQKYGIPLSATVFTYGGNLGKPQGIDFVVGFLESQKEQSEGYFVIVGSGTDYKKIKSWFDLRKPVNVKLLEELPKGEYNKLLRSSDVGMIFLDHRFTVPNFPSRLLSYLEYKLPVLAATDTRTDLGRILEENNFGVWSESGDINTINLNVKRLVMNPDLRATMGLNGYKFFLDNFTIKNSYQIIIKHFQD
jgi:glycosyltransferase involved in cell wall biosynthesis